MGVSPRVASHVVGPLVPGLASGSAPAQADSQLPGRPPSEPPARLPPLPEFAQSASQLVERRLLPRLLRTPCTPGIPPASPGYALSLTRAGGHTRDQQHSRGAANRLSCGWSSVRSAPVLTPACLVGIWTERGQRSMCGLYKTAGHLQLPRTELQGSSIHSN